MNDLYSTPRALFALLLALLILPGCDTGDVDLDGFTGDSDLLGMWVDDDEFFTYITYDATSERTTFRSWWHDEVEGCFAGDETGVLSNVTRSSFTVQGETIHYEINGNTLILSDEDGSDEERWTRSDREPGDMTPTCN